MAVYTFKEITNKAKTIKKNVKTKYKLGLGTGGDKWSYYTAKAVLNLGKDVKKITIGDNPKPVQDKVGRQANKKEYLKIAENLTGFVEKNGRLPNYVTFQGKKLSPRLLTYTYSKILVNYDKHGKLQPEVTLNNKVFTKPLETTNRVYNEFIRVFNGGKRLYKCDDGLRKIEGKGYGGYYDDQLSNFEVIANLKNPNSKKKPNCTDVCQMFMNFMLQLVIWGFYRKVECLHVDCSSGGHVKLRITKNDGSTFIRDVACVISNNGKPLNCVWCTNTPKAVNPAWFMANLNR